MHDDVEPSPTDDDVALSEQLPHPAFWRDHEGKPIDPVDHLEALTHLYITEDASLATLRAITEMEPHRQPGDHRPLRVGPIARRYLRLVEWRERHPRVATLSGAGVLDARMALRQEREAHPDRPPLTRAERRERFAELRRHHAILNALSSAGRSDIWMATYHRIEMTNIVVYGRIMAAATGRGDYAEEDRTFARNVLEAIPVPDLPDTWPSPRPGHVSVMMVVAADALRALNDWGPDAIAVPEVLRDRAIEYLALVEEAGALGRVASEDAAQLGRLIEQAGAPLSADGVAGRRHPRGARRTSQLPPGDVGTPIEGGATAQPEGTTVEASDVPPPRPSAPSAPTAAQDGTAGAPSPGARPSDRRARRSPRPPSTGLRP